MNTEPATSEHALTDVQIDAQTDAQTTAQPVARTTSAAAPSWAKWWLIAAGIYNIAWGAFVVLAPATFLRIFGVEGLTDMGLAIWQCVGMIVGVYGVGYLAASANPYLHWPITLVGLLGKVFGPIGFLDAALIKGIFPPTFGLTIVTNDLIWWVPFALILWGAWTTRHHRKASSS